VSATIESYTFMLKMIIREKNPIDVVQCYSCEEAFSVACTNCDINKELFYLCPSCKKEIKPSITQITIDYKMMCLECFKDIYDVISITRTVAARKCFHLGKLD
jgi:hypothetical protein